MLLVHEKKTDGNEDFGLGHWQCQSFLAACGTSGALLSSSSEGENRKNNALSMLLRAVMRLKGDRAQRMLCKWEVFAVTIISIGKTSISASLSN